MEKLTQNPEQSVVAPPSNHKRLFGKKARIAGVVVVVLVAAGLVYYFGFYQQTSTAPTTITKAGQEAKLANSAYLSGDKDQAIEHAKKVLAYDPNDIQNIIWLASMVQAKDPAAAKQYYAQALEGFKKLNDPDTGGKPAATYWSAASLAQKAGQISQAKHYYQEVITAANEPGSNQHYLAARAQSALKDLQ